VDRKFGPALNGRSPRMATNASNVSTKGQRRSMKKLGCQLLFLTVVALAGLPGRSSSQSSAPYIEGPVWEVQMIRAKYGLEDDYFNNLRATLKNPLDEAKKQKVILDYKIFFGEAASPQDYNVMILVEFQNMAAFDDLRERLDPILVKAAGSVGQQTQIQIKRMDVREVTGEKVMREITLK
jgi:hypothetical protein